MAELALDKDGRFLAVRLTGYGNVGAYLAHVGAADGHDQRRARTSIGVYRTPLIEVSTKVRLHQHLAGRRLSRRRPARGQLLHGAADRHRRRARWASTASSCAGATTSRPRQMPYKARVRHDLRQRRLHRAARQGARRPPTGTASRPRKAESQARGKLRGRGIGNYLEVTAPPMQGDGRHPLRGRRRRHHHHRHARLRPGPLVALRPGADRASSASRSSSIRLLQGDSDQLIAGGGTGGSKSIMASGAAIVEAGDKVIEQGQADRRRTCWRPASPTSSSRAGRFTIAGTDRGIGIMELAEQLRAGADAARGRAADARRQPRLRERAARPSPTAATSPRSRSIPTPASIEVVRYTMVNDFGTVINPLLVEGQAAWRRGAGHRPGADGAHRLRRGGPAR